MAGTFSSSRFFHIFHSVLNISGFVRPCFCCNAGPGFNEKSPFSASTKTGSAIIESVTLPRLSHSSAPCLRSSSENSRVKQKSKLYAPSFWHFQLFALNFSSSSDRTKPSARTICFLSVRISHGSDLTPHANSVSFSSAPIIPDGKEILYFLIH